MNRKKYIFDLDCPRCKDRQQITLAINEIDKPVNCGNCLLNNAEVVAMEIVRTEVVKP